MLYKNVSRDEVVLLKLGDMQVAITVEKRSGVESRIKIDAPKEVSIEVKKLQNS